MADTTHTSATGHAGDTHAVTEAADQSVIASLGINTQLFVFQLINFAIVGAIVWFLILKPLTKKLEERSKMVAKSVDDAKRIETNLQMSEQQYQNKIDEAKVEANKLLAQAQEEAAGLGAKMKEKAEADVEQLIKQAKSKIAEEKEKMTAELREETGTLVIAAVEKIIGEKVDAKKDAKLIEDSLKGLKS